MIILGWDIGIKNLAYCKLEQLDNETSKNNEEDVFKFNNKSFSLMEWNVINITDQVASNNLDNGRITLSNLKPKCNALKPLKNKYKTQNEETITTTIAQDLYCNRNASFITIDGKIIVCDKHYNINIENDKKNDIVIEYIPIKTEPKCMELIYSKKEKSLIKCSKKSICVLVSNNYIGYCSKHKPSTTLEQSNILLLNKKIKSQHINLTKLGIALYQQLDLIKDKLLDANIVLLENQPVLKNPTMKSVQMLLYSYFILKGIVDNSLEKQHTINEIKCYMANKKTELSKYLPEDQQEIINTEMKTVKNAYLVNKKTSVLITTNILSSNTSSSKWLEFFQSNTKKDDLADAFLMTLHYLLNN